MAKILSAELILGTPSHSKLPNVLRPTTRNYKKQIDGEMLVLFSTDLRLFITGVRD